MWKIYPKDTRLARVSSLNTLSAPHHFARFLTAHIHIYFFLYFLCLYMFKLIKCAFIVGLCCRWEVRLRTRAQSTSTKNINWDFSIKKIKEEREWYFASRKLAGSGRVTNNSITVFGYTYISSIYRICT